MDESKRSSFLQQEIRDKFNVPFDVPTVYIDPVLPVFDQDYELKDLEEDELEAFYDETEKLWNFGMNKDPFMCEGNCQSPKGYFAGQPWVSPNKLAVRDGQSAEVVCKIWNGLHEGASKNFTWKLGTKIIYCKSDPLCHLPKGYLALEDPASSHGHFLLHKLQITKFDELKEGNYSCNNGLEDGTVNAVSVLRVVDAQWSQWGPWTPCTLSCINESNRHPGYTQRARSCIPPRNGGAPCRDQDGLEKKECAGPVEGPMVFCPVDGQWTMWGDWEACSVSCITDRNGRHGQSRRTRACIPARHGGKPCNMADAVTTTECAGKVGGPVTYCPVDGEWQSWGEWSSCSISCMKEKGGSPGQATRTRQCSQPRHGGRPCKHEDRLMRKECAGPYGFKFCPEDYWFEGWSSWSGCHWSGCNHLEGWDKGYRTRTRVCHPARHGGRNCPAGGTLETDNGCKKSCGWRKPVEDFFVGVVLLAAITSDPADRIIPHQSDD